MHQITLVLIAACLLSTVVHETDCCSSFIFGRRLPSIEQISSDKQRMSPQPETLVTTTTKPVTFTPITKFIIDDVSKCEVPYDTSYCLNGGRCGNVTLTMPPPIGNGNTLMCECVDHYIGRRCEEKMPQGHYAHYRHKNRQKRRVKRFIRRRP